MSAEREALERIFEYGIGFGAARRTGDASSCKSIRIEVDKIIAALAQPPERTGGVNARAWLIEWPADRQNPVRYWGGAEGPVIGPHHAVRFCRKQDAEEVTKLERLLKGARPVEHKWIAPDDLAGGSGGVDEPSIRMGKTVERPVRIYEDDPAPDQPAAEPIILAELPTRFRQWSSNNFGEAEGKPHEDMPSRWFGRGQAFENAAIWLERALLRARQGPVSASAPQDGAGERIEWTPELERARLDLCERLLNHADVATYSPLRASLVEAEQALTILGDIALSRPSEATQPAAGVVETKAEKVAQLQREIGARQAQLQGLVLGDPAQSVSVFALASTDRGQGREGS